MSIIYDALKKTQNNRIKNSSLTQTPVISKNLDGKINRLKTGLLVISILLFITIFTYYPRIHFRQNQLKTEQIVLKNPQRITPLSQMNTQPPLALVLKGIFIGGNQRLAIINGQRLQIGDEVEGLKIIRIHKNQVVLKTIMGQ